MKKRSAIISLMLCLSIALTACVYTGYSGERSDLFTIAINSVSWLNGYSTGADFVCDSEIEILDTDRFGRTIFTYHEEFYSGESLSFSALIVCQGSNKREVFFYEDVNFLVKEQIMWANELEEFSEEEIEYLKSINDWNQPINYDKCIKKEITTIKPEIPHKQEIENQLKKEFGLTGNRNILFVDYMTSDASNTRFMFYGVLKEDTNKFFIGIVETENNMFKQLNLFYPSNVYDYRSELIEFKKANNWQY